MKTLTSRSKWQFILRSNKPQLPSDNSYGELWVYPFIALLLLPGVYWIFIDQSVWAWDESWYGTVAVDLWYTLIHTPTIWFGEMLRALVWETGTRAPGIAWSGQFFVPLGQLLGSIETGLLLWVILIQYINLIMIFQIGRTLCPLHISQSIIGILVAVSAPLFVALGHLMYVEPLQMLGVTYFYWIAVKSARWDKITIIAHLLLAISISMLAKASSPLYCILPGILVLSQLVKRDKWDRNNNSCKRYGKMFFVVAVCLIFSATVMWYVRNIGLLYSFVVSTTTGEIAKHYGQQGTFLKELQYWLSVFQRSFFTPEMFVIIGIALLAILGIWIVRQDTKRWNSQSIIALIALLQVIIPIIVFSMQIDEIQRFMLPVLPSVIVLTLAVLSLNPSRVTTTVLLIFLSLQWLYVSGVSLGEFSPNDKISQWIRVPQTDIQRKNELERIIKLLNNKQNQLRFTMVGMSLPWLNHKNLSFYTAKDRLSSGYQTYFVEPGYFETSEETAWERINNFNPTYFLTLHEDSQPKPPDNLNLVSLPILNRIRNDSRFVPIQFESDPRTIAGNARVSLSYARGWRGLSGLGS
jgi:hypothetical protein